MLRILGPTYLHFNNCLYLLEVWNPVFTKVTSDSKRFHLMACEETDTYLQYAYNCNWIILSL